MSDKNNLGITTPLGIDLTNFSCTNEEDLSEGNADVPLIIEIETPHKNVKNILQKRRDTLKKLAVYWQKGNISEAMKHLSGSKDIGVANDFFTYAFMKNGINKDYLKLDDSIAILPLVINKVEEIFDFTNSTIFETLSNVAKENEIKPKQLFWIMRIAITGQEVTPGGATEIAEILGKEECLARLNKAVAEL